MVRDTESPGGGLPLTRPAHSCLRHGDSDRDAGLLLRVRPSPLGALDLGAVRMDCTPLPYSSSGELVSALGSPCFPNCLFSAKSLKK